MGVTFTEFAPRRANSFLSELTPVEEKGEEENGRVASLGSVPICRKVIASSAPIFIFITVYLYE